MTALRRMEAERSVTFKAWRSNRPVTDCPTLAIAQTLQQAIAAVEPGTAHKAMVFVLQEDAGRNEKLLAICTMRQESRTSWRRNPVTGASEPVRRTYLDVLHILPVREFKPLPPFDAFRDDPVGRDLQLVEQG